MATLKYKNPNYVEGGNEEKWVTLSVSGFTDSSKSLVMKEISLNEDSVYMELNNKGTITLTDDETLSQLEELETNELFVLGIPVLSTGNKVEILARKNSDNIIAQSNGGFVANDTNYIVTVYAVLNISNKSLTYVCQEIVPTVITDTESYSQLEGTDNDNKLYMITEE